MEFNTEGQRSKMMKAIESSNHTLRPFRETRKKFIKDYEKLNFLDDNLNVAIITPDKDIIKDAETLSPAYIVFDNYEIILKWNRSLRFALAVCTLKDKIKNEL